MNCSRIGVFPFGETIHLLAVVLEIGQRRVHLAERQLRIVQRDDFFGAMSLHISCRGNVSHTDSATINARFSPHHAWGAHDVRISR